MEAELWKRVEELFRAAQAQPPEKRTEFLEKACPDDPQVRREVQSLLDAATGAASFLVSSPLSSALTPGAKLGHFEILGSLGRGGMGEVYRARDSRLEREVAIKVLPVSFAGDPGRIARFEREARATSALNHPNIVSIYDIGRENSTYWIVSELVDGETLRRTIDRGPLAARKALDIAVQIAEGLAAAHAAGIVHRDLKPGNIMFTRSGRVKILDFGLAKREPLTADSSTLELTNEGAVLGTAGYMSPEQVRGQEVDYRSDIFSFGVVLYEILAGKQTFNGSSSIELMNAILKDDPPDLPPSVPPALERIVRRCLRKDPASRFQSAADLGFALASVPASRPAFAVTLKKLTRRTWKIATAVSVAAGLIALSWFLLRRPSKPSVELTQKRLTFNSSKNPVGNAAISPDGKYLAYSDPAGIHVKLLSTGEERLIPRPTGVPSSAYWDVDSWFPDSNHLLADTSETGGHGSMWTVSLLGQSPRQLREISSEFGVHGYRHDPNPLAGFMPPTVSPDGAHIAFSSHGASDRGVWVMDSQGDNLQRILAAGDKENFYGVRWSPDGQRLVYLRTQHGDDQESLETCNLKGAGQTVVVSDYVNSFWWLPDGRIVYTFDEILWQIGIDNINGTPEGKPKRLTQVAAGSYLTGLSVTADGKGLVLIKMTDQQQIYVGELAVGGTHMNPPRRLTNNESYEMPRAWTPDSKAVLFDSNRNGKWGIFKQGISQETPEPVFTGTHDDASPTRISADGAWILFLESSITTANPTSPDRLMRIQVSGGVPQFVLETRNSLDFGCARAPASLCVILEPSQDQKQLIVTRFDPLKGRGKVLRTIEKDPEQASGPRALSPDGSTYAISKSGEAEIHVNLLSLSGGSDREVTVNGWPYITGVDWSPDGKGLYCGSRSPRGDTLLYVDLKGNARVLWQDKGGGGIIWGIPSPDGRYVAILNTVSNKNVVMVEGF